MSNDTTKPSSLRHTVIIPYSQWARGGKYYEQNDNPYPNSALLMYGIKAEEKDDPYPRTYRVQCCLGHLASSLGIKDYNLYISYPAGIFRNPKINYLNENKKIFFSWLIKDLNLDTDNVWSNSRDALLLAEINDDTRTCDLYKECMVSILFAEHNIDVEFVV